MPYREYLIVLMACLAPIVLTWWVVRPKKANGKLIALPKYLCLDSRKEIRQQNHRSIRVFIAYPMLNKLVDGWVVDYSKSGLGIMVSDCSLLEMLAVNRTWNLKFASTFQEDAWIRVHIKSCKREANGWRLGCQFVNEVPRWLGQALSEKPREVSS